MRHTLRGQTLTVYLSGELDHHSASQIRQELDALIRDSRARRLVLDLSSLTFMDSSGIGVILGRYNQMARRGGSPAVRKPSSQINRIFDLSGVYQIVERL